jgi:hypothetical protein
MLQKFFELAITKVQNYEIQETYVEHNVSNFSQVLHFMKKVVE